MSLITSLLTVTLTDHAMQGCCGLGASRASRETRTKRQKKGVPGASRSTGTPTKECGGVLLSHTLSSAVPSPRPGLSFRVRKGTGRLTWAMTTAKPIQRPTPTGRPAEPEPCHDSDRGGPGTGQRTQATKRFTGIVIVTTRNNAPCHPTKETTTGRDPTQQAGRKKCAAFAR